MRTRTTGRTEDPGTPPSVRAEGYVLNKGGRAMGSPLRMPEQWSDSDYSASSRAIRRGAENTKNRVRTGPAAAAEESPLRMSASDPEQSDPEQSDPEQSDPEQLSDSAYRDLSHAIWRESENTKNRVRNGPAETVLSHAQAVYVLIFNQGMENEGVYTLQSPSQSKPHLLTFENSGDADRFANLLQGQGLDQLGKPLKWESATIVEYCGACEYAVTLVPAGTTYTPPQTNEMGEDLMQTPAKQKRDDHALGLHMYKAERENLERLFGL